MAQKKKNGPAKLADLSPNPLNPRRISPERLAMLKDSLAEFGDLSGFVLNRRTGRLVGGHQRQKVLAPAAQVQVEQTFPKATKSGTLAVGHVQVDGERFAYREVDWPERKEKAAMLAANQHGGEWIWEDVSRLVQSLGDEIDLSLLGFDEHELDVLSAADWQPDAITEHGSTNVYSVKLSQSGRAALDQWKQVSHEEDDAKAIESACINAAAGLSSSGGGHVENA